MGNQQPDSLHVSVQHVLDVKKWTKSLPGFMKTDRFVDGEALWILSTGTGLGPFISILRDEKVWSQFKKQFLVHGIRHEDELAYQSELLGMQVCFAHAGKSRYSANYSVRNKRSSEAGKQCAAASDYQYYQRYPQWRALKSGMLCA